MYLAWESDLEIIPVLNKIDLPNAKPDSVAKQIENLLPVETKDILRVGGYTCILYLYDFNVLANENAHYKHNEFELWVYES